MGSVEFPDWRADVAAGLARLAQITPRDLGEWPDLSNAIHWVVDDTWWDHRSPRGDVSLLLTDQDEAAAVEAVLDPLLKILDELGPVAPDVDYVQHPSWPLVAAAALKAQQLLERP